MRDCCFKEMEGSLKPKIRVMKLQSYHDIGEDEAEPITQRVYDEDEEEKKVDDDSSLFSYD